MLVSRDDDLLQASDHISAAEKEREKCRRTDAVIDNDKYRRFRAGQMNFMHESRKGHIDTPSISRELDSPGSIPKDIS